MQIIYLLRDQRVKYVKNSCNSIAKNKYAKKPPNNLIKKWAEFVAIWMDLEGTVLSEISQTRQILRDTTYTWTLKKSQTHRNRD